jgi:hypothetical protein
LVDIGMDDGILLVLCAAHCFALAAFHLLFWKLFGWHEALPRMSVANRAILQIANLRLIYLFLGVGVLCLMYPQALATSALGRALMWGMVGFWLGRCIEQFVFLRYNRASLHVLTAVFALGAALFAWPLLN